MFEYLSCRRAVRVFKRTRSTSHRRAALLLALVLAVASRALAGGAGGEFAVDVRGDGEPLHDAAFDAEGGGGTAREPAGVRRPLASDDGVGRLRTEEEGLTMPTSRPRRSGARRRPSALEAEALAAAWAADAEPEPEPPAPDPLDEEKRRKLAPARRTRS